MFRHSGMCRARTERRNNISEDLETMDNIKKVELSTRQKILLDLYTTTDESQREAFIDYILEKPQGERLLEATAFCKFTDEEEAYMKDLMRYDTLTAERQQEVMEYHRSKGRTDIVIEGVKNMAM